jgi:hypothetical protein
MSNLASLNATITGGTITADNGKVTMFTTPIVGYIGDPLFCKILVSGSTLIVLIDKDGPSQLGPITVPATEPVTRVSVTVKSQTSTESWAGPLASPYKGEQLDFAVEVASNLLYASFALRIAAAAQPAAGNPYPLGYIAVEVDGQPGTYRLFFLDKLVVPVPADVTTARFIPGAQIHGGIGGPMGVGLP